MTIAEAFHQKLVDWQPASGRQTFTTADEPGGWRVHLIVDRQETVGCLAWELSLRRTAASGLNLAEWAARAARRVTGLREPLQVLEIDAVRGEALLRSREPEKADGKVRYYELIIRKGEEAVLRRYRNPTQ